MKKLSDSQALTLLWCYGHQGTLVRWPGGFWTVNGIGSEERNNEQGSYKVPDWSTGTNTVRSLEKLGLLIRSYRFYEEWKDDRLITKAGIEAVLALPGPEEARYVHYQSLDARHARCTTDEVQLTEKLRCYVTCPKCLALVRGRKPSGKRS